MKHQQQRPNPAQAVGEPWGFALMGQSPICAGGSHLPHGLLPAAVPGTGSSIPSTALAPHSTACHDFSNIVSLHHIFQQFYAHTHAHTRVCVSIDLHTRVDVTLFSEMCVVQVPGSRSRPLHHGCCSQPQVPRLDCRTQKR